MKRISRFIGTILYIITVMGYTNAQPVDSLIAEGLRNNPGLRALERSVVSAEYRSRAAGYLPPPSIGVEFSQVPFEDPDPVKQSLSQNLILSQMIMLGGKLSAMEEAESKLSEVKQTELQAYRLQLIEDIKKVYYDTWMMEHHIELREQNIEYLQDIIKSAEQYYQINRSSYSELLLLKAEIAANRSGIEVMENELQSMYYMMNSLLGRSSRNEEIIVQHTWEPDTASINTGSYEEQLFTSNPSLLRMDRMEEMNRLEITANNKELYPDLMLQGMLMRMPRGMLLTTKSPVHMLDGMGETEYMFSLMASVTLPFVPWSSGKIKNKEEELLASIDGIGAERRNMELMLESQLYSLVNSVESSRREMRLLETEVIPLYKQAVESQLSEFRNNRNSIVNIIQTLNMLLMKEEELAEAVTRNQKTLAEIETISAVSYNRFNK
jgi:outer membrane protein, heavy metal efflux system